MRLSATQLDALEQAVEYGHVVVEWPWCDLRNAFRVNTLRSLAQRGLLRYVEPVQWRGSLSTGRMEVVGEHGPLPYYVITQAGRDLLKSVAQHGKGSTTKGAG